MAPSPRAARGQSLVEFSLLTVVLLYLAMAIFDFGFALYSYVALTNGVREGARYAVLNPSDTAGIDRVATDQLAMLDHRKVAVTHEPSGEILWGTVMTVTLTYTYTPITPFIGSLAPGGYELRARSSMRTEN